MNFCGKLNLLLDVNFAGGDRGGEGSHPGGERNRTQAKDGGAAHVHQKVTMILQISPFAPVLLDPNRGDSHWEGSNSHKYQIKQCPLPIS